MILLNMSRKTKNLKKRKTQNLKKRYYLLHPLYQVKKNPHYVGHLCLHLII